MPRYFFHVEDTAQHVDADGVELTGLDAAREHAISYFADLLRESGEDFWRSGDWLMRVTDDRGLIFFTLHFAATLAAAAGRPASI